MYAVFFIDFFISNAMKILWRSSIVVRVLLWRQWGIKTMYLRGENPRVVWIKNAPVLLEKRSRLDFVVWTSCTMLNYGWREINIILFYSILFYSILLIYMLNNIVFWKQQQMRIKIMDVPPLQIILPLCNHARAVSHFAIMGVIPILQSWTLSYVTPPQWPHPLWEQAQTPTTQWSGHLSQGYWAALISSFNVEPLWPFSSFLFPIQYRSTGKMYFVFCRLYPSPPSHQGSIWILLSSLYS
jgi:hypothetical protein